MDYHAQSSQLASTFALEYAGYNATDEQLQRELNSQLTNLDNVQLFDTTAAEPYYILFKNPLELTIGGEQYRVKTMKKNE